MRIALAGVLLGVAFAGALLPAGAAVAQVAVPSPEAFLGYPLGAHRNRDIAASVADRSST